ncbi:RluA family pseudouridine synthase [Candidatus Kaiserbacteria bacterium]|nr:RluA family pseudouridine synthase [Candidatus Kaiserbacteria bacterium]
MSNKWYGREMELPILYEDADIVAVNKPAGLLTHCAPPKPGEGGCGGRTEEASAEEWFEEKYPEADGGYAHRLDRDTSGVLVFAKTKEAYEFLRKAFSDRDVKKTYLAFVYGVPKEKEGSIDFDIGRSRKDFRLRSAQPKAKGRLREAMTRYKVLGEAEGYSLLEVFPETGRTHQIRVHLKAIHHPVVGDALYAPGLSKSGAIGYKPQSRGTPNLGIDRLGLHAYSLDLPLLKGGRVQVTAPVPTDLLPAFSSFPEAVTRFKNPLAG